MPLEISIQSLGFKRDFPLFNFVKIATRLFKLHRTECLPMNIEQGAGDALIELLIELANETISVVPKGTRMPVTHHLAHCSSIHVAPFFVENVLSQIKQVNAIH